MALSDRIAVMHLGELMQVGPPREVYTRPANRTVADFMGLVNLIPARVARAAGDESTVVVAGVHDLAIPLPRGARAGQVIQLAVRPENVRVVPASPESHLSDRLRGTIAEATFLGNLLDCYVALDDGTRIRVQAEAGRHLDVGQPVVLHLEKETVTLFDV
jgi:ABC-type Fe3+/spermidine/putrescine transport system ATPase subunit